MRARIDANQQVADHSPVANEKKKRKGTTFVASHYVISALLWSTAFAFWLAGFVPLLSAPAARAGS